MVDRERILERYGDRIGTVYTDAAGEAPADGAAPAPCEIVELHALERFGHAYATVGASDGPLQHEIVMVTTDRFAPYAAALLAVVRAAPALGPGVVLPHAIPETPFTALLCLPLADSNGSFAFGRTRKPPFAYRLAPLTAAEQALAERDPEQAASLLRSACALTADRFRPCLVDVPPPRPASRTEIAMERRQARAAIVALREQVLREHGRPEPDDMPPSRTEGRLRPGAYGALRYWVELTIGQALRHYRRHPPPVVFAFAEILYVTIATHPDAVLMIERAVDPRSLPIRAGEGPDEAARRVTETVVVAVARFHGQESEEALLAGALPAVRAALSAFDEADEIPLPNHLWAAVLPAVYEGLQDPKRPALRGMHRVVRRLCEGEALLEYEPDPRPPLLRLNEIVERLAIELVTAYAAERRGQLPG